MQIWLWRYGKIVIYEAIYAWWWQIFVKSRHKESNGEQLDFDFSDLESLCIDSPEEISHSKGSKSFFFEKVA